MLELDTLYKYLNNNFNLLKAGKYRVYEKKINSSGYICDITVMLVNNDIDITVRIYNLILSDSKEPQFSMRFLFTKGIKEINKRCIYSELNESNIVRFTKLLTDIVNDFSELSLFEFDENRDGICTVSCRDKIQTNNLI